jgi:hypothetical protein
MPSPILPGGSPPILTDTLAMDDNFPKLLSNPALLGKIESALQTVGKTYQDVINELVDSFNACNDSVLNCLNSVIPPLVSKYHSIDSSLDSLTALVVQEINQYANTIVSAGYNIIHTCFETLAEALLAIPDNCFLAVPNVMFTPYINWPYPYTQDEWYGLVPDFYYVDKSGKLQYGYSIDQNGEITTVAGLTVGPEDITNLQDFSNFHTLFPSPLTPPLDKICKDMVVCAKDTFTTVTTHKIGPIVPIIQKIIKPITSTGGTTVVASGGTDTTTTTTTTTTTESNSVTCPAPIINVTVLPAPVTVTCPPTEVVESSPTVIVEPSNLTPPTAITTSANEVGWEPDVKEVSEQLLNALGFPKDFVLYWGGLSDAVASDVSYDKGSSVRNNDEVG